MLHVSGLLKHEMWPKQATIQLIVKIMWCYNFFNPKGLQKTTFHTTFDLFVLFEKPYNKWHLILLKSKNEADRSKNLYFLKLTLSIG